MKKLQQKIAAFFVVVFALCLIWGGGTFLAKSTPSLAESLPTAEVTGVQVRSNGANTTEDFIVLLSEKYSGQSGTADSSRNTKSKVKIFMSPDDTTGKYLTEVCGGWWPINYWECGGGLFLAVDNYSSYNGTTIYKITIEAGCELPCGDSVYITSEEVTYINKDFGKEEAKNGAYNWEKYVPTPETEVTGIQVRKGGETENFIVLQSPIYTESLSGNANPGDCNTATKIKVYTSVEDAEGKSLIGSWWEYNYGNWGTTGLFLAYNTPADYENYNGTTIYKITIEAGCELPCGDVKYVTTEDMSWYNLDFGNEAVKNLAVHWSNSPIKPEMTVGAAVRLGDTSTSGLRFETAIEKSQLSVLRNLYEKVEFGTLVVPADYLTDGTEFTMKSLSEAEKKYLDIPSTGFVNAEDEAVESYRYYGSIVNIKAQNYTRDFAGIGYIKLTAGNIVSYIYADYDENNVRNIYEVSKKAYEDRQSEKDDTYQYAVGDMYSRYTSEQLAILKTYLDGVVTVTIEDRVVVYAGGVQYYQAPYTGQLDRNRCTITSGEEIKTLIVNGNRITDFELSEDGKSVVFTIE